MKYAICLTSVALISGCAANTQRRAPKPTEIGPSPSKLWIHTEGQTQPLNAEFLTREPTITFIEDKETGTRCYLAESNRYEVSMFCVPRQK